MSETTDLALRMGLASRLLDFATPEPLVQILQSALGLPFTQQKFSKLDPAEVTQLLVEGGCSAQADSIEKALSLLINGLTPEETFEDALKAPPSKAEGSVRVGMASNSAGELDGHFGSCQSFWIYDITPTHIAHVETRHTLHLGAGKSMDTEKTGRRVELIRDCDILCVQSIGGPPAARAVNAGIMPLKYPVSQPMNRVLTELQGRLSNPPPWLSKSMGLANPNLGRWSEESLQ